MSSDKSKPENLSSIQRMNSYEVVRSMFETKINEEKLKKETLTTRTTAAAEIWKEKLDKVDKNAIDFKQPKLKTSSFNFNSQKLQTTTNPFDSIEGIKCTPGVFSKDVHLLRSKSSITSNLSQISNSKSFGIEHNSNDILNNANNRLDLPKSFQDHLNWFESRAKQISDISSHRKNEKVTIKKTEASTAKSSEHHPITSSTNLQNNQMKPNNLNYMSFEVQPESLLFFEQCEQDKDNYVWSEEINRINHIKPKKATENTKFEQNKTMYIFKRRNAIKRNVSTKEAGNVHKECTLPKDLPWCKLIRSGAYPQVTHRRMIKDEIKLFENMYEIITSEETYLNVSDLTLFHFHIL